LTAATPTYTAPAATASAQSVTITATSVSDKTKSSSVILTIPAAPAITTTSLLPASTGLAYSATLAGSGGIPPYTWKLISGTLPTGMSFNPATGVISAAAGTTTATPATSLTFQMTDSGTPTALTATAVLSLIITTPQIGVSVSAPSTTVDGSDTVTLTATVTNDSSNAGVTWTAPALGSLSSLTMATPTYTAPKATTSAQSVTLTATSVSDKTKSGSVTLTIPPAPGIFTNYLTSATEGLAYSATLIGSGGIPPYTWKLISGTLPTGMSFNPATGVISAAAGTTTETPATSLTFQMTDSGTPTPLTASKALDFTVYSPIIVTVGASSTTVDGGDTVTLSQGVAYDGSDAGVTWTAPTIGSLSSTTSSSPIYTAPAATTSVQSVTITATSVADKTKSGSVTLTIPVAPTITTTSLPAAWVGTAYSATLTGSGGIAPYTWKLISGTLPTGMSLNATTGVLSAAAGTTTATPATPLTFQMTDSGSPTGLTATVKLSLTITSVQISGVVSFNSVPPACNSTVPKPAVSVSINTSPVQTVTTDSEGNFGFGNLPNGTYTITPSLPGTNAIFTPATQSVTVNNNSVQTSFKADVGYAISGTASYTGTAAGPIYLVARSSCGGFEQGTSISAPGPFTINGVEPGNYTIYAWKDALNNGAPNASDPTGSAAAGVVSSANLPGVSVALTDPAAVTSNSSNMSLAVVPIDKGVVLSAGSVSTAFDSKSVFQQIGVSAEMATTYTVQWSASSTFATVDGSQSFPATGYQSAVTWVLNGLTNGQTYYFRYQGVAGSVTSQWSAIVGPFTIGQPAGTVTVSGNVTFTNAATGPLYIGLTNQATNETYYTAIANPVSPQPYSIKLPADGTYEFLAFIDQNKNNVEDSGDMQRLADMSNLVVTGSSATQDLTLVDGGNSYVTWGTLNLQTVGASSGSMQQYSIQFQARDESKHLVAAELLSGPNAITPQDLLRSQNSGYSFNSTINLYGNTPKVGDSYSLQLTYSDGTKETLTEKVPGVVDSFSANTYPAGVGTDLTPTFTWTYPANTSSFYHYFYFETISIPRNSGGKYLFWFYSLSGAIDSITWGVDPTGGSNAPSSSLVDGEQDMWVVWTGDGKGNGSEMLVYYYPGYTGVSIPATNPSTLGSATVGKSYTGTIAASGGTAPYTFTVTGLSDGLSYVSSGGTLTISGTPTAAGTVTFQVTAADSSSPAGAWGPVTYTINATN
jgi:hypothetical protein